MWPRSVRKRPLLRHVSPGFVSRSLTRLHKTLTSTPIHHISVKWSPKCHKALLSKIVTSLTDGLRNEREQILQEAFYILIQIFKEKSSG